MKTILLYGELGKQFGKRHRFAVRNVAEAIRALKANFKGFEPLMCSAEKYGIGFRVVVGKESLTDLGQIKNPVGSEEVIKIIPVLFGSKSGFFKIFLGIALVAAAVAITVATGGTLTGVAAHLVNAGGMIGVSMIIGGVAQLLSKPPEGKSQEDSRKDSYIFSGPQNTAVQGKAVPVGYGRMIVGSAVISAGIETHEEP